MAAVRIHASTKLSTWRTWSADPDGRQRRRRRAQCLTAALLVCGVLVSAGAPVERPPHAACHVMPHPCCLLPAAIMRLCSQMRQSSIYHRAVQVRTTPETVRPGQRQTTGAPLWEPLPGAMIGWICIQGGASGITARGTMLWDIGITGSHVVYTILREHVCVCVCMCMECHNTVHVGRVRLQRWRGTWLWHAAGLWTFPTLVVVVSAW